MDGATNLQDDPPDRPETAEARQRRLVCEAALIAEARAQLDAGQGRTGADLDAWLDAWEGDGTLPPRRQPQ
jgi:hypothetical protein